MSSGKMMGMEENTQSAFSAFDFTSEDVEIAMEKLAEESSRGKPICMCGHPEGRHGWSESLGVHYCSANKQNCKCKKMTLVVEAEYARVFLRKTTGPGPLHALAQGIRESEKADKGIKWIVDVACDRCKKAGPVSPCPVNQRGSVMYEDTGMNALLCSECRLVNG
jgi:hypothetical protein